MIEPLIIADGTLATGVQQQTYSLREVAIWRFLSKLSSALAFLHSQPSGPVLASDLSPHTVISVYETEREKKANIITFKLLLLGSSTGHSLDLSEVFFPFYSSQLITLL